MMPLWIFTLGRTIFNQEALPVPYQRIASFAIGLVVPLAIGLLIQRYLPSLAKLLVRILKTCSSLLIIFIIIFAIVTNLYLFELFTWQVSTYLRDDDSVNVIVQISSGFYSFILSLVVVYQITTNRYLLPVWRCLGLHMLLAGVLQRCSNKNTRTVLRSQLKQVFKIPASQFIYFEQRLINHKQISQQWHVSHLI